jgi:cytochrome c
MNSLGVFAIAGRGKTMPLKSGFAGLLGWLALAAMSATNPAAAQSSPKDRGEAIAKTHCARCHAIADTGDSPMGLAPPFRDLSKRYPIGNLAEALAEGIITGHPAMPRFTFEPREIDALLTYLGSLTPSTEPPVRKR